MELAKTGHKDVSGRGATIYWSVQDDNPVESWVEYGPNPSSFTAENFTARPIVPGNGEREDRLAGLLADTTYYYQVCARDIFGNRAPCSPLTSFRTVPAPTEAAAPVVGNVAVSNIAAYSARVSWSVADSSGSVSTFVEYAEKKTTGDLLYSKSSTRTGPGDHSLPIQGLKSRTEYYYRVYAVNSVDKEVRAPIPTGQFMTDFPPDLEPPRIETDSLQVVSTSYSSATIQWIVTDDIANPLTRVEWSPDGTMWTEETVFAAANNPVTQTVSTGLTADRTYFYRIFADDSINGHIVRYPTAAPYPSFHTAALPVPAVDNVTIRVDGIRANQFNVSWVSQGPAGSLLDNWLEYGTTSLTLTKKVYPSTDTRYGPGTKKVSLGGLKAETLYHFRVVANASSGMAKSPDQIQWTALRLVFTINDTALFNPSTVTASTLRPIHVNFQNADEAGPHSWAIYGYAIDTGGITAPASFSLAQSFKLPPGTYTFYCHEEDHTETGTLTVTPVAAMDVLRNVPKTITVSSSDFVQGATVPSQNRCDGQDDSPQLSFANLPRTHAALAVLVENLDWTGGWIHWTAWNIPAGTLSIPFNANIASMGGTEGANSWGSINYRGPCLNPGQGAFDYSFKVFALDAPLSLPRGLPPDEFLLALDGHVLAWGEIQGTYAQ